MGSLKTYLYSSWLLPLLPCCLLSSAAGYYLTGGLGIPGRYLGLHCDSVTALEVVLFNGTIIRADAGRRWRLRECSAHL